MNDTLTWGQATDLIATMLRNIRAGGGVEDGTFSLEEVAERCNVSYISLVRDCRSGRLEHVGKGRRLSMTSSQVAKMLALYTRGGDQIAPKPQVKKDEMAEARAASAKAAKRQPRRVA